MGHLADGPKIGGALATVAASSSRLASATLTSPFAPRLADSGRTTEQIIKDMMRQSDISVQAIVLTEFQEQLRLSQSFNELTVEEDTWPQFHLVVRVYGLSIAHGFTSKLEPMLGVEGSLVAADETILWQRYEYVTAGSKFKGYRLQEYLSDPELLREAFKKAAAIVVGDLVSDLGGTTN